MCICNINIYNDEILLIKLFIITIQYIKMISEIVNIFFDAENRLLVYYLLVKQILKFILVILSDICILIKKTINFFFYNFFYFL